MENLSSPNLPHGALSSSHLPAASAKPQPRRRGMSISQDPQLSTRELEVLALICQEFTNFEIGDRLCLSPRTVETYRRTMMEKIGCRNTVGLVLYALRNNVIALHPPQK